MRPSELDPDRWRRIDEIFEIALETPAAEREAFLAETCGDDQELRAEVDALLEAHARAGVGFDPPADLLEDAIQSAISPGVEGRRVGPFRLLREIGRGGMGVVYLAEDTRLGRRVALKALPPYLGLGPRAKRRFLSEARAIAALDHPNIATLYEADQTAEGQLYMALALYEGETLEERIRRGPLPVNRAIEIAAGVAAGLDAAHERRIVHRDVKPSNVLLTERGDVKLLDFGVAKVAGEEVTRDGVRPGTIAYMSPEQAEGRPLDRRTDLWSLGVVLYEMLTGTRPFAAADQRSLIRAILRDAPDPPGSLRSDLPQQVERVVDKLLCKAPEGRYRSAADLLEDLEALRSGGSPDVAIREPPPPADRDGAGRRGALLRRGGGQRAVGVLAGLVVLAAGGLWIGTAASGSGAGEVEWVAVLPLADRTGDDEHRHLVDGMHDALIAELGKIGALDVLSRTSVVRYRDSELAIPEIARELDVDALVEGSVFLDGDTLAITASLVEAEPERRLWTGSYRRPLGGVYQISSEVARSIAAELGITLTPAETARLAVRQAVDPRAYDAFALGQFHLEQRSRESFDLARRYFRAAIEIDSTFAPAYAGLAQGYGSATFFGLFPPSEAMPRIKSLAETALRHDSTLARAHNVLALVELYWEWDWEEAERHARGAIELAPSDAGSHRALSEVLAVQGRYEEALESVERGSELGRMVAFSTFRPVAVLNYMRDFDRAIERVRGGLRFFTDFWQGHWLLCEALAGRGLYERAVAACEDATRLSNRLSMPLAMLGYVYARGGRRAEAERVAAELEDRAQIAYVGGTHVAVVYGALGRHDRAFAWLERAIEQRDVFLVHLNDHVWFDPLRSDPRFDALLDRIGLERG